MWTEAEIKFLQGCLTPALRKANFLFVKHSPAIAERHPMLSTTLNDFPQDRREILINVGPFLPGHRPNEQYASDLIKVVNEYLAKRYYYTRIMLKSAAMMGLDKKKNGLTDLDCLRIVCNLSEDY